MVVFVFFIGMTGFATAGGFTFESGQLLPFHGAKDEFSLQSHTTYSGQYALRAAAQTQDRKIASDFITREQGDEWTQYVYLPNSSSIGRVCWGEQNTGSYGQQSAYCADINDGANELKLVKMSNGGYTKMSDAAVDFPNNEWLGVNIDWGNSGTMTVTIKDEAGNTVVSQSMTDTDYTSGGVGFNIFNDYVYWDNTGLPYERKKQDSFEDGDISEYTLFYTRNNRPRHEVAQDHSFIGQYALFFNGNEDTGSGSAYQQSLNDVSDYLRYQVKIYIDNDLDTYGMPSIVFGENSTHAMAAGVQATSYKLMYFGFPKPFPTDQIDFATRKHAIDMNTGQWYTLTANVKYGTNGWVNWTWRGPDGIIDNRYVKEHSITTPTFGFYNGEGGSPGFDSYMDALTVWDLDPTTAPVIESTNISPAKTNADNTVVSDLSVSGSATISNANTTVWHGDAVVLSDSDMQQNTNGNWESTTALTPHDYGNYTVSVTAIDSEGRSTTQNSTVYIEYNPTKLPINISTELLKHYSQSTINIDKVGAGVGLPSSVDTYTESFEDGAPSYVPSDWEIYGTESSDGSASLFSSAGQDFSYVPNGLNGGKQIDSAHFDWRETSSQTGFTVEFIDSDGSDVLAVGSNNPQWEVYDGSGSTTLWNGDGYDRWIEYDITFDWSNCEYSYGFYDPVSNHRETGTRSLASCQNIETIRYSDDRWGNNDNTWYDNWNIDYSSQTQSGRLNTNQYNMSSTQIAETLNANISIPNGASATATIENATHARDVQLNDGYHSYSIGSMPGNTYNLSYGLTYGSGGTPILYNSSLGGAPAGTIELAPIEPSNMTTVDTTDVSFSTFLNCTVSCSSVEFYHNTTGNPFKTNRIDQDMAPDQYNFTRHNDGVVRTGSPMPTYLTDPAWRWTFNQTTVDTSGQTTDLTASKVQYRRSLLGGHAALLDGGAVEPGTSISDGATFTYNAYVYLPNATSRIFIANHTGSGSNRAFYVNDTDGDGGAELCGALNGPSRTSPVCGGTVPAETWTPVQMRFNDSPGLDTTVRIGDTAVATGDYDGHTGVQTTRIGPFLQPASLITSFESGYGGFTVDEDYFDGGQYCEQDIKRRNDNEMALKDGDWYVDFDIYTVGDNTQTICAMQLRKTIDTTGHSTFKMALEFSTFANDMNYVEIGGTRIWEGDNYKNSNYEDTVTADVSGMTGEKQLVIHAQSHDAYNPKDGTLFVDFIGFGERNAVGAGKVNQGYIDEASIFTSALPTSELDHLAIDAWDTKAVGVNQSVGHWNRTRYLDAGGNVTASHTASTNVTFEYWSNTSGQWNPTTLSSIGAPQYIKTAATVPTGATIDAIQFEYNASDREVWRQFASVAGAEPFTNVTVEGDPFQKNGLNAWYVTADSDSGIQNTSGIMRFTYDPNVTTLNRNVSDSVGATLTTLRSQFLTDTIANTIGTTPALTPILAYSRTALDAGLVGVSADIYNALARINLPIDISAIGAAGQNVERFVDFSETISIGLERIGTLWRTLQAPWSVGESLNTIEYADISTIYGAVFDQSQIITRVADAGDGVTDAITSIITIDRSVQQSRAVNQPTYVDVRTPEWWDRSWEHKVVSENDPFVKNEHYVLEDIPASDPATIRAYDPENGVLLQHGTRSSENGYDVAVEPEYNTSTIEVYYENDNDVSNTGIGFNNLVAKISNPEDENAWQRIGTTFWGVHPIPEDLQGPNMYLNDAWAGGIADFTRANTLDGINYTPQGYMYVLPEGDDPIDAIYEVGYTIEAQVGATDITIHSIGDEDRYFEDDNVVRMYINGSYRRGQGSSERVSTRLNLQYDGKRLTKFSVKQNEGYGWDRDYYQYGNTDVLSDVNVTGPLRELAIKGFGGNEESYIDHVALHDYSTADYRSVRGVFGPGVNPQLALYRSAFDTAAVSSVLDPLQIGTTQFAPVQALLDADRTTVQDRQVGLTYAPSLTHAVTTVFTRSDQLGIETVWRTSYYNVLATLTDSIATTITGDQRSMLTRADSIVAETTDAFGLEQELVRTPLVGATIDAATRLYNSLAVNDLAIGVAEQVDRTLDQGRTVWQNAYMVPQADHSVAVYRELAETVKGSIVYDLIYTDLADFDLTIAGVFGMDRSIAVDRTIGEHWYSPVTAGYTVAFDRVVTDDIDGRITDYLIYNVLADFDLPLSVVESISDTRDLGREVTNMIDASVTNAQFVEYFRSVASAVDARINLYAAYNYLMSDTIGIDIGVQNEDMIELFREPEAFVQGQFNQIDQQDLERLNSIAIDGRITDYLIYNYLASFNIDIQDSLAQDYMVTFIRTFDESTNIGTNQQYVFEAFRTGLLTVDGSIEPYLIYNFLAAFDMGIGVDEATDPDTAFERVFDQYIAATVDNSAFRQFERQVASPVAASIDYYLIYTDLADLTDTVTGGFTADTVQTLFRYQTDAIGASDDLADITVAYRRSLAQALPITESWSGYNVLAELTDTVQFTSEISKGIVYFLDQPINGALEAGRGLFVATRGVADGITGIFDVTGLEELYRSVADTALFSEFVGYESVRGAIIGLQPTVAIDADRTLDQTITHRLDVVATENLGGFRQVIDRFELLVTPSTSASYELWFINELTQPASMTIDLTGSVEKSFDNLVTFGDDDDGRMVEERDGTIVIRRTGITAAMTSAVRNYPIRSALGVAMIVGLFVGYRRERKFRRAYSAYKRGTLDDSMMQKARRYIKERS